MLPPEAMPSSIDVGPFMYTVESDELDLLRTSKAEHEILLGHCDEAKLQILVDLEQAAGQLRDTLLHEALHAVFAQLGLDDELGQAKEEMVIRRLSPALLALLRRNPQLVSFLTAT